MIKKAVLYLFLAPLVFPVDCRAGDLSLGVGYPYISAKYDFKTLAVEGRYINGLGVQAYAGRGYWNFHQSDKLKGFTGLEGGYIRFDTLDTKGAGSEVAVFLGGEYFATKNFSLLMDFAPTLISLKHDTYKELTAGSIEYVVNFGLYYHFGESQPKAAPRKVYTAPIVPTARKETVSPEVKAWLAQLSSPDWQERRKAAFELGKLKAVVAVNPLLELLEDENEKASGVAAMALGRIGDRRALSPLIERLEDESAYVRASAAKALGYLGDTRAVKALKNATKDGSEEVRNAIEEALDKLNP